MKRFLFLSLVLGGLFVASWAKMIPVKCHICGKRAFHASILSLVCGGYEGVTHAKCFFTRELATGEPFFIPLVEAIEAPLATRTEPGECISEANILAPIADEGGLSEPKPTIVVNGGAPNDQGTSVDG